MGILNGWMESTSGSSMASGTMPSVTTDNTAWIHAHQEAILFGAGMVKVEHIPWKDQNKTRSKKFLEQLREEIGDWHGDVLERAA